MRYATALLPQIKLFTRRSSKIYSYLERAARCIREMDGFRLLIYGERSANKESGVAIR